MKLLLCCVWWDDKIYRSATVVLWSLQSTPVWNFWACRLARGRNCTEVDILTTSSQYTTVVGALQSHTRKSADIPDHAPLLGASSIKDTQLTIDLPRSKMPNFYWRPSNWVGCSGRGTIILNEYRYCKNPTASLFTDLVISNTVEECFLFYFGQVAFMGNWEASNLDFLFGQSHYHC